MSNNGIVIAISLPVKGQIHTDDIVKTINQEACGHLATTVVIVISLPVKESGSEWALTVSNTDNHRSLL